jgi:hypothetical protein
MITRCEMCGELFNKPPSRIKRSKHNLCGKLCLAKFQESKTKKSCSVCGKEFLVRPSETKRFVTCNSERCRQTNKSRDRNPNWRGGTYSDGRGKRFVDMTTKRYKSWRLSVFERDKFTCQMCGRVGGDLCADHIKPYAYFRELRYELENGRTLCVDCHKTTYKETFKWRKEQNGLHIG